MLRYLLLPLLALLLGAVAVSAQPTGYRPGTITSCSPTTSSALCIGDVARYMLIIENTSLTAVVACIGGGGTAALNSTSSFIIYAGQRKSWSSAVSLSPPAGPIHCISSSGTATLWIQYL
jgi:hypothetical protein